MCIRACVRADFFYLNVHMIRVQCFGTIIVMIKWIFTPVRGIYIFADET